MRLHTALLALLAVAALLCLIGGAGALQDGTTTTTTMTTAPTTTAGGAGTADLTNAGSPQAAQFVNNTSTTMFGTVPGFEPNVSLELVASDFITSPMVVAAPDDDTGRVFVVDQIGVVKIVDANGTVVDEPFLDIRDRLVNLTPIYDERGLLSIAFHPDYQNNGKVYAFYSAPLREGAPEDWNCTNHLSEFTVSEDNPDQVNASSEKVLMYIDKPYHNHNGGQIAFSPADGYLYIPLGDGGRANDVGLGHTIGIGNAQDLTKIYGKILRIDVDGGTAGNVTPTMTTATQTATTTMTETVTPTVTGTTGPNESMSPSEPTWTTFAGTLYGIPDDNPYVENQPEILDSYAYDSIPPEIYAYGFRNPAYMSFDSGGSNALFTASAGQTLFESVFTVLSGGNYGWNILEGTHCFDPNNSAEPPETCNITGYQDEPLIGPIVEGGHDLGNTIVGGQVYRGTMLPDFQGRYVFGYWSIGRIVGEGTLLVASPPEGWNESAMPASAANLTPEQNQMWTVQEISVVGQANQSVNEFVRSIGEGPDGELYLLTNTVGGPDAATETGKLWKIVPPANATAEGTPTTTTAAVTTTMATTTTTVAVSTPSPAATTAAAST